MATEITTKRWDDYVQEAEVPPFRLVVSDEETVEIACPTGEALLKVARAGRDGDHLAVLEILSGESWNRVSELVAKAPYQVMLDLSIDLQIHFGMTDEYEMVNPSGGKKVVRDPRQIRTLRKNGWKVVGER